jgi:spore germination protein KC
MKIFGRLWKVLVCALLIVGTCGCWSSRELDKLGIVMGMGVDKGEDPGTVKITAQVVNAGNFQASGNSGEGGSSGQGKAYINFVGTGDTVFSTVRDITNQSSRKLYFPQNQVLVFGRSAAEEGVGKYLDFFLRDPETRLNVFVLVAQDSAADILSVTPEIEDIPAQNIKQLVEDESDFTSQAMAVRLSDFKANLMTDTKAAVAPIIETFKGYNGPITRINGTAVFKGGKLVGSLNKSEGRGLAWVLGKVKSGIVEVRTPEGNLVSLEIVRSQGKFSPEVSDGNVKIKVSIREICNIGEQQGPEQLSDLSEVAYLEQQSEDIIRCEVTEAVRKAQELDADIFGFGESVYQKYPKQWADMKGNWDELFRKVEVEVQVDSTIRLMGRISAPAVGEQENS